MTNTSRRGSITIWAWLVSLGLHIGLLAVFAFVKFSQSSNVSSPATESTVTITQIEKLTKTRLKHLQIVVTQKEPPYTEMLDLIEGAPCTREDLMKRLGTSRVSVDTLTDWASSFEDVYLKDDVVHRTPYGKEWEHEKLVRCVASELARCGYSIRFSRKGEAEIDIIASRPNRMRKIFVECKTSQGGITKGIGQLMRYRRSKSRLWLAVPTKATERVSYDRILSDLEVLKREGIFLVLYDTEKFEHGEAVYGEKLRPMDKRSKRLLDFLGRLRKGKLEKCFNTTDASMALGENEQNCGRKLAKLAIRGLLKKIDSDKYSFRFRS